MIDDSMFQERVERLKQLEESEAQVILEEESPQPFTFGRLFTFPLSSPGLTVIGFFVLVPFLLRVVMVMTIGIIPLLGFMLWFLVIAANVIIVLSTVWYVMVCIRVSAEGQMKAPDLLEYSENDSLWDWLRQLFLILSTICLCLAPAFSLKFYFHFSDLVFWTALGIGVFFLPMCLLAISMFDNINALNPFLIIASIFSTFFSYILVVLLFFVPIALVAGLLIFSLIPLLSLPVKAISLYLLMVDACLLGRFFYKNEEKLRWDV